MCTGGYREAFENALPEGAIEVDTSRPYVFVNREVSENIIKTIADKVAKDFGFTYENIWDRPEELGGNQSVGEYAFRVYDKVDLTEFNGVRDVPEDKHRGSYESMVEVY